MPGSLLHSNIVFLMPGRVLIWFGMLRFFNWLFWFFVFHILILGLKEGAGCLTEHSDLGSGLLRVASLPRCDYFY